VEWTNERVDEIIGLLLRCGVIIAATVVMAGGAWRLLESGTLRPDYHIFHGEPRELRSATGVLKGVSRGDPEALIQFGLLLLIATPVARVLFSVFAFWAQRDWVYVGITLLVLTILVYSLAGGAA
jgi:uncharacterized membrane protein